MILSRDARALRREMTRLAKNTYEAGRFRPELRRPMKAVVAWLEAGGEGEIRITGGAAHRRCCGSLLMEFAEATYHRAHELGHGEPACELLAWAAVHARRWGQPVEFAEGGN